MRCQRCRGECDHRVCHVIEEREADAWREETILWRENDEDGYSDW